MSKREIATRMGFFLAWPFIAGIFMVFLALFLALAWPLWLTKLVPMKGFDE